MIDAMPEHVRERIVSRVPLGRAGDPADIANAVAFLAFSDAAYMTGQVVYAEGADLLPRRGGALRRPRSPPARALPGARRRSR
jgi:NAD(P)-dependent dehydrogenase (short-subunit alcohol dehydrogenase family)